MGANFNNTWLLTTAVEHYPDDLLRSLRVKKGMVFSRVMK